MEIKRSAFGKGDGKAGNGVEVEALSVVRSGVETIKERGGGKGDKGRNQLGGGLLGMVIGSRFRSRAFAGLDSVSAGWPVEFTPCDYFATRSRIPEEGREGRRERGNFRILIEIDRSE